MLYMILTIMCSSGMSLSIKLADRPGRNMRVVTVINYLMTVLLCYVFFASTFWRKMQNIFGECCISKLEKVARPRLAAILPAT